MKLKIHSSIKVKELLFYIAIIFYCAEYYISASVLDYKLPKTFLTLLQLIVLLCLLMKWIMTERYTLKKLVSMFVIMISSVIVATTGNYISLLLFVSIVFLSTEIDFDKIIQLLEINIWMWLIIIILLCKVGFLEDYTYWHNIGTISTLAHSWGFKYYGWLGYTAMALSMMWVYRHKEINVLQGITIIILNFIFYKVHTTNLPLILTIGFVVLCYLSENALISKLMDRVFKILAWVTPFGLYAGTWILIILYKKGKFLIEFSNLNTIISRIKYSAQAIEIYGLHLFGTHVTQIGNVDIYYRNASSTNAIYIDSGFVYSTIAYGLILTVIFLIIYTLIGVYLSKKNNYILSIWLLMMMAACCVNNFMCDIINNPIILLLPSVVLSKNKNSYMQKKETQKELRDKKNVKKE